MRHQTDKPPNGTDADRSVAHLLRDHRLRRGWTQQRLIHELKRIADMRDWVLPTSMSLQSMISRWENGHHAPDRFYRALLSTALGISNAHDCDDRPV
jgi:transcriptional regulator with XRE-family HTH domain